MFTGTLRVVKSRGGILMGNREPPIRLQQRICSMMIHEYIITVQLRSANCVTTDDLLALLCKEKEVRFLVDRISYDND